jgi:hypothetical protein
MIVENYLTNLITEDIWGALPLLYAFWGGAPSFFSRVINLVRSSTLVMNSIGPTW